MITVIMIMIIINNQVRVGGTYKKKLKFVLGERKNADVRSIFSKAGVYFMGRCPFFFYYDDFFRSAWAAVAGAVVSAPHFY